MKRALRAAKHADVPSLLTAGGIAACNSDDNSVGTTTPGPDGGSGQDAEAATVDTGSDATSSVRPSPDFGNPALFARFAAGMVYALDPLNKDWRNYDNFSLKLQ